MGTHHTDETFIDVANKDVVEKFPGKNKLSKINLTDTDKDAIEYFSKRNNLVITKADRGGANVVLDVNLYIAKANEKLLFLSKIKRRSYCQTL